MQDTIFAHIDDILGDQCKRFFSSGYKHVNHKLSDIQVNPSLQSTSARASIFYPESWSEKGGHGLTPHLSTLDGLILSIHINTLFINSIYELDEFQKSHTWIRKVHMKSGSLASLQLEDMHVKTSLIKTETSPDSLCGHLTTFNTTIGAMRVEMVIDHYIGEYNFDAKSYKRLEDALEKVNTSYYGSYYRDCTRNLYDLQLDEEKEKISAWVKINYPERVFEHNGISERYYPFYTPIDTFVCAAQQIQALFYLMDDINRVDSNNLWMREVKFENKQPIYRPSGFKQTVKLLHSKLLKRKQSSWRMAEFHCTLDSIPSLFDLKVNVAHELPFEATNNEARDE